ncbi:glucose-1-phosphate adenylyltransferase family protein [Halochromatium roseum]|uniref:glucose-1-phosphate adenylyltransferase family protein n=1 Tax=Halochromatium roseum TaxID=391920 RepID=UPI00191307BF|nr:sugar phosphate nucleotidyltransferase [Halochromatium roseum]MBK5941705.1 glucose-1-phosphate adenylyltransferase [Halochromatium roseum]
MSSKTLTFVFAAERGTPALLTEHRCKAAVPVAGKYRVIDFTLANCLHSGLRQVLVLSQYKSHSLHKHLRDGWSLFNAELGEFITAVPPQMRYDSGWYRNAMDALRQNRYLIERSSADTVLLLDGGLVYRMDYAELIEFHREQGGGLTCALRRAGPGSASGGVKVEVDAADRITAISNALDLDAPYESTMGVVLIDKALLLEQIEALAAATEAGMDSGVDLATQLVSPMLDGRATCSNPPTAYRFGGERGRVTQDRYWSDLGSTDAYFRANMDLLKAEPPLNLYQADWNILTYQGQYPPARTVPGPTSGNEGVFVNSMLAAGTVIRGGGVSHSVLYPRVQVEDGAIVDEAILFEGVRIGANARVRRCICDKDVVIPAGACIGEDRRADAERFEVSDEGIVVILKGQVI